MIFLLLRNISGGSQRKNFEHFKISNVFSDEKRGKRQTSLKHVALQFSRVYLTVIMVQQSLLNVRRNANYQHSWVRDFAQNVFETDLTRAMCKDIQNQNFKEILKVQELSFFAEDKSCSSFIGGGTLTAFSLAYFLFRVVSIFLVSPGVY